MSRTGVSGRYKIRIYMLEKFLYRLSSQGFKANHLYICELKLRQSIVIQYFNFQELHFLGKLPTRLLNYCPTAVHAKRRKRKLKQKKKQQKRQRPLQLQKQQQINQRPLQLKKQQLALVFSIINIILSAFQLQNSKHFELMSVYLPCNESIVSKTKPEQS